MLVAFYSASCRFDSSALDERLGAEPVFVDTRDAAVEDTGLGSDVDPGTDVSDSLDTPESDSVDPDSGGPDSDCERNVCGGCQVLSETIGDACGSCGLDTWMCDGSDSVVCSGDTAGNECGGCESLTEVVGSPCGTCGIDSWVCVGTDEVVCSGDSTANACGGCSRLAGEPGEACGSCGLDVWVCDGEIDVACTGDTRSNACGGCGELEAVLGSACGTCGLDTWVCDGEEAVACDGDTTVNACGGCTALAEVIGDECGTCGLDAWECAGAEGVACSGDTRGNPCGGCGEVANLPGTACGPCGLDTWECDGRHLTVCSGETALNECGGCSSLDDSPGDTCGTCGLDVLECSGPEALACDGDTVLNSCGGCEPELAAPGHLCWEESCDTSIGPIGELICADSESVCACFPAECGNGVLDVGEECDDGGLLPADGCDASCELEHVVATNSHCPGGSDDGPFELAPNSTVLLDACDAHSHHRNIAGDDCVVFAGDGREVVTQLTLESDANVTFEAYDEDAARAIDARIYVRTTCDDETSQVGCNDDIHCADSFLTYPCHGDEQVSHSLLNLTLAAGTYFVIIDTYEYEYGDEEFRCGQVRLNVTSVPTDIVGVPPD